MQEGNNSCRQIDWDDNKEFYAAWETGRTGFPFVDAIMRWRSAETTCILHLCCARVGALRRRDRGMVRAGSCRRQGGCTTSPATWWRAFSPGTLGMHSCHLSGVHMRLSGLPRGTGAGTISWQGRGGNHCRMLLGRRGDLYLSWERGRDTFDRLLIDGDHFINNGNWQWLSCSAFFSQYFRVRADRSLIIFERFGVP